MQHNPMMNRAQRLSACFSRAACLSQRQLSLAGSRSLLAAGRKHWLKRLTPIVP